MPPELAAATGAQDVPSDNVNFGKPDVGQSDLTKARVRPPLVCSPASFNLFVCATWQEE